MLLILLTAASKIVQQFLEKSSNFFNCEINLNLACVVADFTSDGKFKITNTKLYVPVVTLSTQGNAKLLERLKSIFKRTVNCDKF